MKRKATEEQLIPTEEKFSLGYLRITNTIMADDIKGRVSMLVKASGKTLTQFAVDRPPLRDISHTESFYRLLAVVVKMADPIIRRRWITLEKEHLTKMLTVRKSSLREILTRTGISFSRRSRGNCFIYTVSMRHQEEETSFGNIRECINYIVSEALSENVLSAFCMPVRTIKVSNSAKHCVRQAFRN